MAIQSDIEAVLNNRMDAYDIAYPIDIVHPNTDYSPVEGTNYLQVYTLHAETFQPEIGQSSRNRAVGIYQININVPIGEGRYQSNLIATQLQEYFKRSTGLTYNDVDVIITKFYFGSEVKNGAWYTQIINVGFRSDIEN